MRIFYFCNIADDSTRTRRAITSDSPAALRKVEGVYRAWSSTGNAFTVISDGRGTIPGLGDFTRFPRERTTLPSGMVIEYASSLRLRWLAHLYSAFSIGTAALKTVPSHDAVAVFYNAEPHCLLALALLRLRGTPCLLDIEDGLDVPWLSIRGFVYRLCFAAFRWSCCGGFAASSKLASVLPGGDGIVISGVTDATEKQAARDWDSARLQVLFSGTLNDATGVPLFLETLNWLRAHAPESLSRLHFVICGQGPMLPDLLAIAEDSEQASIEVLGRVSFARYAALLAESHVALSLKLPRTHYDEQTFPSKTIEIASSGALLVTTPISDVPTLFAASGAVLLNDATAEELGNALISIEADRIAASVRAATCAEHIRSTLGPAETGQRIHDYIKRLVRPASPSKRV